MEGEAERLKRFLDEHKRLVESGMFDELPQPSLEPGDIVAVRANNIIHQVYDVVGDTAVVGFDRQKGDQVERVRESVPIADVKSAEDYQNLIFRSRGLGGAYYVTVEGTETTLWDRTRDN
jgi:hypothetical protein